MELLFDHLGERLGIEEISDDDGDVVVPAVVDGGKPAAPQAAVDRIVVDERRDRRSVALDDRFQLRSMPGRPKIEGNPIVAGYVIEIVYDEPTEPGLEGLHVIRDEITLHCELDTVF